MQYVVLKTYNGNLIYCERISENYLESVGYIASDVKDEIEAQKEDGYEVVKSADFEPLESENGYNWYYKLYDDKHKIEYEIEWTLLVYKEQERSGGDDC